MADKMELIVVGPYQVNCYLVWDSKSGDGVIIDPGDEEELIFDRVETAGLEPKAILLTHGHVDHIAAVEAVKKRYQVPLYAGDGEQSLLANPRANVSAFLANPITAPEAEHLVMDEETISLGTLTLRVLATPGHSPGGVCYLDESSGDLFCGDTLFAGSIGRTDLPGGSFETLMESIRRKIMALPDSITCYPGHGPATTVGAERVSNPFLVGGGFV